MVDCGLVLGCSLGGLRPKLFELMGLSIYSLRIPALRFIEKRFLVYSPMYLYLCPAKQYSPNTCGTWSIVNAYVFKIAQPPMFVLLCFLSTLCTFLVLFQYVLLQIVKDQNLWKLLVLKPYV